MTILLNLFIYLIFFSIPQLQLGVTPIPKSVTNSRIKENFDIFNFNLTADEMKVIESMGTGARVAPFDE